VSEDTITKGQGKASVVTPSGLSIRFESKPRRHYMLGRPEMPEKEGVEAEAVSVTKVLDCFYKGGLDWYGQRVGTAGVRHLVRVGEFALAPSPDGTGFVAAVLNDEGVWETATEENMDAALKRHGMNVQQSTAKTADRGANVHDAFEAWCVTGKLPNPLDFDYEERPYVEGLVAFLNDARLEPEMSEVLVGSYEHGFAGRFDAQVRARTEQKVVTKVYPKAAPKHAQLPLGMGRIDLKTSKDIYWNTLLQLAGYELACWESGYGHSDWRGVLNVQRDGRYQFRLNPALDGVEPDHFLRALDAYKLVKHCEQAVKI